MSLEETKPILHDSGVHTKSGNGSQQYHPVGFQPQQHQQHLIIQPIELDLRHRNLYGYLALAAFILVLINFIMLKERGCQISLVNGFQNFDLIQSFHMTTLIIAIIVFVLSYFNFALVIYDFKLLFYTSAAIIFICSGMLIYNSIAIVSAPCVSAQFPFANQFAQLFDSSLFDPAASNVFSAGDGVGITVFFFDLVAAILIFFCGRRFYQRN